MPKQQNFSSEILSRIAFAFNSLGNLAQVHYD